MIQGVGFVRVEIDDSDEGAYAERAGSPPRQSYSSEA